MIVFPPARGILRGRVFYPLRDRIEPQSNLYLTGFALLNNPALLAGSQFGLSANAYTPAIRGVMFAPTIGLTAAPGIALGGNQALLGVTAALASDSAVQHGPSNVTTYSTAGTYSYSIPSGAKTLNIKLAGAGGGGGGAYYSGYSTNGGSGGTSTVTINALGVTLTAHGGGGGTTPSATQTAAPGGQGGTATGGNTQNVTGSSGGLAINTSIGGQPPPGPSGGQDGLGLGIVGGQAGSLTITDWQGGGGGGPGALQHVANVSGLSGPQLSITIGAHGFGGSGSGLSNYMGAAGMDGICIITWT